MVEIFTSPYSNSAANILGQTVIPAFNQPAIVDAPQKKDKIHRQKLTESAQNLYDQIMRSMAKILFDSLGPNAVKKPIHQYSSAVKALSVCSLYLISVENCQVRPIPKWLVSLLVESIQFGDQLEDRPSGTYIIASFGALSRIEFISAVADLALAHVGCEVNSVRQDLITKIATGAEERFTILERTLPRNLP